MLVLGVTGDVGAGKSTVTRIFAESGATIINADLIAHEIWRKRDILSQAAERWGEDIILPDGLVNSSRVASIVFSDATEYKWLCHMLHPLIRIEMEKRISALSGFVVAEIPLLFENDVPWWVDVTMFVSASYGVRLTRNRSRGWNEDEISRREVFLLDRNEKISRSDIILRNEGDLSSLVEKVRDLSADLKNLAFLGELSMTLSSREEVSEISSVLLVQKLALNAECHEIVEHGFSDGEMSESRTFQLVFLIFEKDFNHILKSLGERLPGKEIKICLRPVKRPGTLLKKSLPGEIRT